MTIPGEETTISLRSLLQIVARCMKTEPHTLDPDVPLTRYGLDSLSSVELITILSQRLGRELPEYLLLDHPDIRGLHQFLNSGSKNEHAAGATSPVRLARMRTDAVLPDNIRPAGTHAAAESAVFLTGVTGFLGSRLLAALLQRDDIRVFCLVRPVGGTDASTRLRRLLTTYGLWSTCRHRIDVVEGDLRFPRFGLSQSGFEALSRRVGTIYHCGAAVNWSQPYEALRDTNVLGTIEVLRLACHGQAKAVHFISTIGVCMATPGPAVVSEDDDISGHIDGLHFGYVQSKWVAEKLLREAAARELPVSIYRPSLIAGHSESGLSDTAGFLSRFLKGCVEMGNAPDLDWLLDCCPVDFVARCIADLSTGRDNTPRTYHLTNPYSRHWRECVLWINLYGYPVRLIPVAEWLEQLRTAAKDSRHALHGLQNFFLTRPAGVDGLTLPELYEEGNKSDVRSQATRNHLDTLSLRCPQLTARLLDRYFGSFIECGYLQPPPRRPAPSAPSGEPVAMDTLTEKFRAFFKDQTLTVLGAEAIRDEKIGDSIITELASWRYGRTRGLFPVRVGLHRIGHSRSETVDVFLKSKPSDREVIEIGQVVADLSNANLGRAYAEHSNVLGFEACHVRELAIYRQRDDRFRQYAPICYGLIHDEVDDRWVLMLEHLSDVALMDSANDISGWHRDYVEAAIAGLARLHAIWYRRDDDLAKQPWLGTQPCARSMAAAAELWAALANFSAPSFREWSGPATAALQRGFVDDIAAWWSELDSLPHTLIHNDFNPRNIAFRRQPTGPSLCAYDWELATLGIPQRDLAELLCFVLAPQPCPDMVQYYVELHRTALQDETGYEIDHGDWHRGFELALRDLIVNRLALYTLMHKFRRYGFLERVLRTWSALHEQYSRQPHTAAPARVRAVP
jgi:thioester reductase-like protein